MNFIFFFFFFFIQNRKIVASWVLVPMPVETNRQCTKGYDKLHNRVKFDGTLILLIRITARLRAREIVCRNKLVDVDFSREIATGLFGRAQVYQRVAIGLPRANALSTRGTQKGKTIVRDPLLISVSDPTTVLLIYTSFDTTLHLDGEPAPPPSPGID